jgi:Ser/Thr protein kinase RdoA (MazF antagonist)
MLPYSTLSRSGQFHRIRPLALRALAAYDLGEVSLEPLQHVENTTYRVRSNRGSEQLVLRIHAPRWHGLPEIRSEAVWLESLTAAGLAVPNVIRARGGDVLTIACAPGVPEARACTLLTWVPGRHARRRRSPDMLRRCGAFLAGLHRFAETFHFPTEFRRPRWDYETLGGLNSRAAPGWDHLTPSQKRLFAAVRDRVRSALRRLKQGPEVFGMIHGDPGFKNLLFDRGEVRAIDFDDCGFGYFLYDLAIILELVEWRPDYKDLRAALLEGYRRIRNLAREHEPYLDLFVAARWMFLGLCLSGRPEQAAIRQFAPRFLKVVQPKLRQFLRSWDE